MSPVVPIVFLTTLGFYSLRYRRKLHPLGRPFTACFECAVQSSLLVIFSHLLKEKTPGVFYIPRVFVSFELLLVMRNLLLGQKGPRLVIDTSECKTSDVF